MAGDEKFDDFARSLATSRAAAGLSRRGVLRGIVAGAFGGLAVGGVAGAQTRASATGPGLANCIRFCKSVFGTSRGYTICVQQARRHTGLCYSCGPESAVGTQPICCAKNSSGYCADYSDTGCCASGTVCQNGSCVQICSAQGDPCHIDADCCPNSGLTCVPYSSVNLCEINTSGP